MSGLNCGVTAVGQARASATTARSGTGRLSAAEDRIAAAALAHLPPSGVVLLDAGPMAERVGQLLPVGCELTVLTNSVSAALMLSTRRDLAVHLLGGRVIAGAGATVAPASLMDGLYVDVAFVVADGVSPERGLTCADPAEVVTRRAMVRSAGTVVLLADHTRINGDRIARFARLDEADCLITDTGTGTDEVRRLRGRGPRVLVV